MDEIFALQDEIAGAVALELGLRREPVGGARLVRQPTQSIAAYELYVRGSDPALFRTDGTARLAEEYFRQAIAPGA